MNFDPAEAVFGFYLKKQRLKLSKKAPDLEKIKKRGGRGAKKFDQIDIVFLARLGLRKEAGGFVKYFSFFSFLTSDGAKKA